VEINVLTPIEAVRKRPGMYLGDTEVWGLFRYAISAVEFALANHATGVEIHLGGGGIRVEANAVVPLRLDESGRLCPFETTPRSPEHSALVALILCALSAQLHVRASDGKIETSVNYVSGRRVALERRTAPHDTPFVVLEFSADPSIFSTTEIQPCTIASFICRHGWRNPDVHFRIRGGGKTWNHQSRRGLQDFFEAAAAPYAWLHPPIHVREWEGDLKVEAFALFHNFPESRVFSFANHDCTPQGGTHEQGLLNALAGLREGIRVEQPLGFIAVLAIEYPYLDYEGSVRLRVGNPSLVGKVSAAVSAGIRRWITNNPIAYAQLREIQPHNHPW
jgi:DNA gyrase subunit B